MSTRPSDVFEAFDVSAQELAPDVVLVTYTTRRDAAHVHRSSLWVQRDGRLQVRFHQATPAKRPDDEGNNTTGGDQ